MRKVLSKRRRTFVCLLIIVFVMQNIFGQAMFALAAEPDSKETGNIMNVELKIGYSGAENLKPEAEAIKNNIRFDVKVKDKGSEGEGESVDEKYITVSNESDTLSKLSMENYDPDKEYTIVASLDYEGKVCSYTFDYGAMTTPESTYDAAVFDATQSITVKPLVSESVDKTFTIKWWDGSNADKQRPSTDGYAETLTDCLQYSTDGRKTWKEYDPDTDITLGFSSSVKENDDNTWSFECKGLAKQVDGEDAVYKLELPSNLGDNGQYMLATFDHIKLSYQYTYCADVKGTIVWNNSALAEDSKPSVNVDKLDIALDVYFIASDSSLIKMDGDYIKKNLSIDTKTSNKNWPYIIKNLPSYDSNGKRIVFVVKERPTNDTDQTIKGFEYSIAYDNKSLSAASDVCYSGGYIINTVKENIDLSFDVNWVEPDIITPDRPKVTYSLWRYAEGKNVPGTSEPYDYSTAAMVSYWNNGTKHTVSETHDWTDSDSWSSDDNSFTIQLESGETVSYPQYDEEGYRYVYFLKQTSGDKMSTDIPGYIETFTNSNKETVDEKVIYNKGTVTNTYNEQVKLNLSKTWKNVKHTSDYRNMTVNLVVTRGIQNGGEFKKDDDYEETISLTDFSSQINSQSDSIMADRYDSDGNEYVYKVQEQILNKYSVELKSEESTVYELNNHSYTCSVAESNGTETDKDGQKIVTHTYAVTNEETEMYDVKFVKQWGSTYNDIDFDELPNIVAYLNQDGKLYATISMQRDGDAVKAVIAYPDGSKTESGVTLSADKKRWTLDEPIKAPISNSDNTDYVYTFSEAGVTPPEGEGETTYYNISYATSTSLLGKETITGTITNNHHVPEEYAYRGIWLYKKWNDDGDSSKRSAIDAHVVIVDTDGNIVYDLSKEDDKNAFINAVSTDDDELKNKVEKELTESNQKTKLSAGNSWQKEILVPKNLDEYAKKINSDYSFTIVEAGLYTVDGTSVIPYTENDDNLIHNDKQQYKLNSSNSEGKNSFTFTNTRDAQMKLISEFDWNDFTNKAGVRPEKVKVTVTRYVGDDKTNIDTDFSVEKTVTISATDDKTTEIVSEGVDEFAPNGKAYHYVAVLEYKDNKGNTIDATNYDVKPTTSYTEPVLDGDKLSNSELTFKYTYDLNDNVSTRDVSFYKIWRDEAKKNDRPDLALKLYQKSDDEGSAYKYLRDASVKCDILNAYAQKYTYFDLPEYKVLRDEDGNATGVELYTYHAKEVINTSDADIYYSYIYAPKENAMDIADFTSYAEIADWDTYVKADYAADYDQGKAEYADENGCFVNGISEYLVYTGTKTWMTMPKGTTKDNYPHVEIYFYQKSSSATAEETAKLNEDIEKWKKEGQESLRKNAAEWTELDSDTNTKFAKEIKLPKYDDNGAAYGYKILECIYRPANDSGTAKLLPDFIMSSTSNGIGTNVFFTNTFEAAKNQRNLIIKKSWTKLTSSENLPAAKFIIYRVEKKDSDNYITDIESLNAADKTAVETVYLNADKTDKTTYSAEKTITGMPIYSPQGNEYVYYAVEDTTYAPSYGVIHYETTECTQSDATVLAKSSTDSSKDYGYVMFSTVCKFEDGVPVKLDTIENKAAFFINEKKTIKTTLTGTVKWVDTENSFDTRPEDKLVYLTVKRESSEQKDGGNNANNKITETLATGSGEWLTKGAEGFDASDTSTAVYKVKIEGTDDDYVYIRWTHNSDNTWTYTITDKNGKAPFDVYADNGNQWKYYVTENKTEGADYQYFAENYTGYGSQVAGKLNEDGGNYSYDMNPITNTLGAKITVQKQWSDTRDQYHFRPVSLQMYLQYKLSNETTWNDYSTAPVTLDTSVAWKKVFDKLPKQNAGGVSYEFRVVETSITINYPNGDTTESKQIGVKYYDSDTLKPVDAVKNSDTLSSETDTVNSKELYVGKAGSYTVKVPKTIAPGTSGSVFFYNTLEDDDVVSLPITKKWADSSAYKNVRPTTVYVKVQKAVLAEANVSEDNLKAAKWEDVLQTDGKSPLVLSLTSSDKDKTDENTWSKTYKQLPKYDALTGDLCFYRAVETDSKGVIKTFTTESGTAYSVIGSYKGTAEYVLSTEDTTDTPYSTALTNTYEPGMKLTITKDWKDDSNRDGKRPDNVTVKVEYHDFDGDKGGTESWKTFDTVTLGYDAKNKTYSWSKTLENLPKYYISETNHEQKLMEYRVSETAVTSYTTSYKIGDTAVTEGLPTVDCDADSVVEKTITVENTYTPGKGNLTVEKKWSDNSDADGERPASIDTNIYRVYKDSSNIEHKEYYNGTSWAELGASATAPVVALTSKGSWKLELKDLPLKTNVGGTTGDTAAPGASYAYTYYFKEVTSHDRYNVDNTEVSTALTNGKTAELNITNTLKMVNINVDFTWDDLKNKYVTRDDYELVVQRKSGTATAFSDATNKDVLETEAANTKQTYSFEKLPMYDEDNNKYDYRVVLRHKGDSSTDIVVSTAPANPVQDGAYQINNNSFTTTGTEAAGLITYSTAVTAKLPLVTVTGTVTWDDQSNKFAVRPAAGDYAMTLEQTITATHTPADPNLTTSVKCTAVEGNTNAYSYTFADLRKYDDSGNEITYKVSEAVNANYTADSTESETKVAGGTGVSYQVANHTTSTDGATYTMTTINNALDTYKMKIEKSWADDNNRDGNRPDTVTVDVLYHDFDKDAGGKEAWEKITTITLGKDKDNNYKWSAETEGLYKYYNSTKSTDLKQMEYKLSETAVTSYTATYALPNADGTSDSPILKFTTANAADQVQVKVINTYTPEKGNLTVEKKWSDNNNADGERPASIDTNIYRVYKDSSNIEHKEYYNGTSWAELGAAETTAPVVALTSTDSWKLELKDLPLKTNVGGTTGDTAAPGASYAYTYYFKEVTSHDRYNVDNTEVSTALTNGKTAELKITNTLKMVNINVDFTWDDLKNKYETRKDYELVIQRKSGAETAFSDATSQDVLKTSAADTKQTYSFENLPLYDSSNNEYTYQVVLRHKTDSTKADIVVSTANTNKQDGAYQITNTDFTTETKDGVTTYSTTVTAKLPLVTVTGTVTWDDQSNKFAVRPAAGDYAMTLEQTITATHTPADPNLTTSVKCTTVEGNTNAYSYTFANLRKYDDSGNEITYKVSEAVNANYTADSTESETKVAGGTGVSYQVANHTASTDGAIYTMTTINNALNTYEIKLTKNLQKADPATDFSFDVYIMKNSKWEKYNTDPYKLKTGNTIVVAEMLKGCEFKIVELEIKDKYTVTADAVKTGTDNEVTLTQGISDRDYAASAKADSAITVTFHNEGLPLSTITVTKNWTGENKYTSISERPQNIYFILQRTTAAASEEAVWDTLTEDSAVKVWTVNKTTATDKTDTQWKYDISGMPAHSSDNKWFTYRAVETDSEGNPLANDRLANYAVTNENCVLTNTYITADLNVAVNWSDSNDAEKVRPESVDCTLYYFDAAADEWKKLEEPVTISKDNWNYTYKDLPVYDSDGNPIKYKVEQNEVDKYTTSYSPQEIQLSTTGTNEIKINNYHAIPETVKKINVKAEVSWNDYDNTFNTRESIDFVLQSYVNGTWQDVTDPITGNAYKRTADSSWKATFYDLPLYDSNNKQIYYRVVIESFGGVKDVVSMQDKADGNGINGNKQNGSVGVYTADATTTFTDTVENAYYLTHINCTYAYKLAIDNVTQNPVDKNKTNAGGRVQVLDEIDLSEFDIDNVPDPDQASSSGFKSVKLGVLWKAEEYWTADNDITIVYTTKAGEKKTLNLNVKDIKSGNLSKQAKEDFPNMAIYEKDGKYVLILADKVTEMPKSVDVKVSFKPTYGIVNLTKAHAGGIVRNASGQYDSYSDGVKELDGHGKYTNPKVLATADKGYCIDMNNLYLSCKDELADMSGSGYHAMAANLQQTAITRGISDLQDSKHKIKVSGNTFTATVWTVIDGKRKATVVKGTISTKKNSNGEVTELTMSTSFKYPLVYGVKFVKEGENADGDKPGSSSPSDGSHKKPGNSSPGNGDNSSHNNSGNSVATGDETPVEILLLLLLSSCGGLAVLFNRRKND